MKNNQLDSEKYLKIYNFIVSRYRDLETRTEMDQIYNLSFFRKEIEMLDGNINKAFSYLLMISKLQVFIDGNKRTALLSAIHHLAYSKQPLLMFFSDFTQEYLKSLKHFYETGDNEAVSNVLYKQLDINR